MTASRVMVRPPHSHRGLLVMAAVFGALAGIPGGVWSALVFSTELLARLSYSLAIYNAIMLVIIFAPLLALMLWLPRQCQHGRWIAAAGASYSFMVVVLGALMEGLASPAGAFNHAFRALLNAAILTLIGTGLIMLSWFIHRTFLFRHVEQDGALCNHCAYPAGRSDSAICPECGRENGAIRPTRSERLVEFFSRRARSTLFALVGVIIAGNALIWWHGNVHRTFGQPYGDEWQRALFGSPIPQDYRRSSVMYRRVAGEADMLMTVHLVQTAVWERRRMYVRLGHVSPTGLVQDGDQVIYAEVPRGEVRNMIRHAPPEELIERLIETGRNAEWKPAGWPQGNTRVPWSVEE